MAFKKYSEQRPEPHQDIVWRMMMRTGQIIQISGRTQREGIPSFAHWNGYTHEIPNDLEWNWNDPANKQKIIIEGVQLKICPWCRNVPEWKVCQSVRPGGGDGVFVGPNPVCFNTFWIQCCSWISNKSFADPVSLAVSWNEAFR